MCARRSLRLARRLRPRRYPLVLRAASEAPSSDGGADTGSVGLPFRLAAGSAGVLGQLDQAGPSGEWRQREPGRNPGRSWYRRPVRRPATGLRLCAPARDLT